MKHEKERTLLCVLIATVFLVPLMGNTAMGSRSPYYFNDYDPNIAWERDPDKMVDGYPERYASTTIDEDVQLCDENSYSGPPPSLNITKVEIRARAKASGPNLKGYKINLTPVFGGTTDGLNYTIDIIAGPYGQWSQWFDITNDPSAPDIWTWSDIDNLDMKVAADISYTGTIYCSIVQIQVNS